MRGVHKHATSFWKRVLKFVTDGGNGELILRQNRVTLFMDEPNSTILLQQNPSFGETLYQVHFSCRRRVLKTTTPQPFYGPFSGTTQVSRCQKRTSGLYGAREDLTEADTPIIRRHSIWTNLCPPPPSPIFYRPDALPAAQPTVSKH